MPSFGGERRNRRGLGNIDVACPGGQTASVGLWQYLFEDNPTTCAPFTQTAQAQAAAQKAQAATALAQQLAAAGATSEQIAAAIAEQQNASNPNPSTPIDWVTLAILGAVGVGLYFIATG